RQGRPRREAQAQARRGAHRGAAHAVAHRRRSLDHAALGRAGLAGAAQVALRSRRQIVNLTLTYSTDLDDAFMFWALATGRLDPRAYGFDSLAHERADTATLNAWAREGARDVVAVSIATVPAIARDYLLLPHGGSVGRGYGPVIVAAQQKSLAPDLD